ncbi:SGNH/GDSL hydrolase family protein [Pectobacterium peruviense]|uniref:SGNH/GDSL hydrolase family protein n=1 Tax=Pectobacterium peruviense TaxID=2066479 RepID=UPI000DE4B8F4|nr:SGNH/GDSL hydrolase family protein [Pectobacterium peruviense]
MANLPESPQWADGVYQIERNDPVGGGPDGAANKPLKDLTNRTRWLYEKFGTAFDNLGWMQLGVWTVGLEVSLPTQIVSFDGSWYRYRGNLDSPHVIAGASPADDGGIWSGDNPDGIWVDVGDASLRSDLGSSGIGMGASLVTTLTGKTVQYELDTIQYELNQLQPGFTVINSDISKIAESANSLSFAHSVVITGDSLGFNGFGYQSGWGVNGAGYATAQPFGISSWSHLLRDALFTATPAFTSIFDLKWISDALLVAVDNTNLKNIAINSMALSWTFSSNQSLSVFNTYSGSTALIIAKSPAASAVKFDVNGITYDNTSNDGHYQSCEYMLITGGSNPSEIKLQNVRNALTATPGGSITVYGVTHANRTWAKITAKGGYTSAQVLSEYDSLVGAYSPNIVYYIIGANDISSSVPVADFKTNIASFIERMRSDISDAVIVLMSPPPMAGRPYSQLKPYISAMRDLAVDNDCSLIDLYHVFAKIDPAYWRHDNIHFKKQGDDIVFNVVKNLTFPALRQSSFSPIRECAVGYGGRAATRTSDSYQITVTATAGAPTVNLGGRITPFIKTGYTTHGDYNVMIVEAPAGFRISNISEYHPPIGGFSQTIRFHSFIDETQRSARFFAANGSASMAIAGSGLMCIISINRDTSLI